MAADIPWLVAQRSAFWAEGGQTVDNTLTASCLESLMRDRSLGEAWLVLTSGVPAGYAVLAFGFSLEFHGRDALVDELYILPGLRGQGLGRAFLGFLEGRAGQAGARFLHVESMDSNPRAREFYRKLGYRAHPSVLMSKRLA